MYGQIRHDLIHHHQWNTCTNFSYLTSVTNWSVRIDLSHSQHFTITNTSHCESYCQAGRRPYEEICGREQMMKDVIKQGVFSAIISVKKLVLQGRLEERNVTFLDM